MTWWHRERSRRRRATRAIMKPRIDVCWGVQLCTGWWLNSRFVRHRQQTETSEKDRHQRRMRSRASLLYTLHGHRSFLIFLILRVPCIPPSIYPFVFFLFLSFPFWLSYCSVSFDFFPFPLFRFQPDWKWTGMILNEIPDSLSLFSFHAASPLSVSCLVLLACAPNLLFYIMYKSIRKRKKKKKRGKKRRGEPAALSAGAFPSFLSSSLSFISSNVL